jgi:hypothetical protein
VRGPDDVRTKLDEVLARIERLNLQQMTVEPKRAQELQDLLDEARKLVEAAHAWQREQEDERRLAQLFEGLGQYTTAAHDRLSRSEERLERVERLLIGGRRQGFEADPEIVEEGEWLKGMLFGPTSDDSDPQLLKDARRVRSARDALAAELSQREAATTAKTTGSQP